ncbi:MAG: ParA family protein [Oscillospiraceae bacterium]|jgi:chromosome partitioning protein|nr:ParA family protein [Oscillospiraceae bacterium]
MGTIITVANQKGGVAKTTTAINLSAALGQLGKKVLVVDLDPQGNTTTGYGIRAAEKKLLKLTTYNVVMGETRPADAVRETRFKNVRLMPSTQELAEAEIRLLKFEHKTLQLRKALLQVKDDYDVVIVDTLPSLGVLALNGIAACDSIIIPMQCEPYSLEGVAELFATVKRIKKSVNKSLQIMGIVFTMTDKRLMVNREVMKTIRREFPEDAIFRTEIPRNVKIAEAPSHGEPIIYYEPSSKGSQAYISFAKEVMDRL